MKNKKRSKTTSQPAHIKSHWKPILGTILLLLGLAIIVAIFSSGSPASFIESLFRPDTNTHFAIFAFLNYIIAPIFAVTLIINSILLIKRARITPAIICSYPILATIFLINLISSEFMFYRRVDCTPVSEYELCQLDSRPGGIFLLGLAVYTAGIITVFLIHRRLNSKS